MPCLLGSGSYSRPGWQCLMGLLIAGGWACTALRGVERLEDGTLRAQCGTPLSTCLEQLENEMDCERHGYDVLYAQERREQRGTVDLPSSSVRSEAIVRCRQAVPLFGVDPNPPSPAPPRAASPSTPLSSPPPATAHVTPAPSSPAPPRCVPGVSVACTSVAGCAGAQVCTNDGSRSGPCECPPAEAPPLSPDTDGGAP
ncbi:MAG: hypothetical protein JW940_05320 [Polyangiaceae bacterium]|nr:hypothetical protein [Polyangiaceae bacterium]